MISRLTGIRDEDLAGAPSVSEAIASLLRFLEPEGDTLRLLGHNIGFDLAFLERAGFPAGVARLDTAELASILLPTASSYALQRLAADAQFVPGSAHRALDDSLTAAAVLAALARRARALPLDVLEEAKGFAVLLGDPTVRFFEAAAQRVIRGAWADAGRTQPEAASDGAGRSSTQEPQRPTAAPVARSASEVFAVGGPLAQRLAGYEDRPQQRELAEAVERTFVGGGVLVAEAGTGVGKSMAYLVPALGRAAKGERVIASTYTLPLQDQLVRKDLPALQAALGTSVPVAVLKGRSNYLCPRRWQVLRGSVETRDEARLVLKTIIWRLDTTTGDRAEINLMSGEAALWPRICADDESCDTRRCARSGGCYLERARSAAADAGIVVVNHALLLHDARMRNALLPRARHVIVDEAHRLEDVASDVLGHELEQARLARDLDRIGRSALVVAALRDPARAEAASGLRDEIDRARERSVETFGALAALIPDALSGGEDRLRVTPALRSADERWLAVELAGERLADALAGVAAAAERIWGAALRATAAAAPALDEVDAAEELESATRELEGARMAIARGVHDPRPRDVVWLALDVGAGSVGLHVAPSHVGGALRRLLVDPHDSVVFTSATLGVAGSLDFALERFGVRDLAATLQAGSPFDYAEQCALIVPTDIALPAEPDFVGDVASVVGDVARALRGATLVLFTAHSVMREVAQLLEPLEDEGLAVLTQGLGGSRRALLERFTQGGAVLLGTQSFWEGVDLPGELLRCVVLVKLPFAVPDDPLVAGRAERYDDPFREFHLPQAALRLRQGFGRLIRSRSDRGAVVLLDRRVLTREYGATFLASLPEVRLRRAPKEAVSGLVLEAAGR